MPDARSFSGQTVSHCRITEKLGGSGADADAPQLVQAKAEHAKLK
jgi:hypothetical protein